MIEVTFRLRMPVVQGDFPCVPSVMIVTDKPTQWEHTEDIKEWGREFATFLNSNVPSAFVDGMVEELKKTYSV